MQYFVKDCSRFHVDYYGASFLKHKKIAEESGLSYEIIDSFRLHTDVDEEDDLVELLIHGTGQAGRFLRECGLELLIEKGRVSARRLPKRAGSGCGDRKSITLLSLQARKNSTGIRANVSGTWRSSSLSSPGVCQYKFSYNMNGMMVVYG